MRLALFATIDRPRTWKTSTTRIHLAGGDVYRVPRRVGRIRIVSGHAWVSFAGQDTVLAPGQQMAFAPGASNLDIALVSGIDRTPLVLEMAKK